MVCPKCVHIGSRNACMCLFGNLNFCGYFSEIWKSLEWKDFPVSSVLDLLPSPEAGVLSSWGQVSSPFSGESLRMFFILIDFVEPHLPSQGFLQSRYKTNYDHRFYFRYVFSLSCGWQFFQSWSSVIQKVFSQSTPVFACRAKAKNLTLKFSKTFSFFFLFWTCFQFKTLKCFKEIKS